MHRFRLLGFLAIAPIVAAAAVAHADFTVKASHSVTAAIPRAVATQLVESAAWREAFIRCASDPLRVGEPKIVAGADAKNPDVELTARFQCGPADAPDLAQRIASAKQVIVGHVVSIAPAGIHEPISEHAANWQIATIEVRESLKGVAAHGSVVSVYFPASSDVAWLGTPRFMAGQDGVWLLRDGAVGLTAPTALDFHPLDHRDTIWSLAHP